MIRKTKEEKAKFMMLQDGKNSMGSENIKSFLQKRNMVAKDLRSKLAEFGIKKSEPTIYNWINNPLCMNRIESNAVAKALQIPEDAFDAMIQGRMFKMNISRTIEITTVD